MLVKKSFLKWVGSKARIVEQLLPLLPSGKRFVEPFIGSGTVFLNVNYDSYILSDLNPDLINTFCWVRDDLAGIYNATYALFTSEIDYYSIRREYNLEKDRYSLINAARFIYLNRHCFNGVYRCNKKGDFNVPKGSYNSVFFPKDALINFSNKLNETRSIIYNCNFKQAINNTCEGDVIYCDPPYITETGSSFCGYTKDKFSQIDTKELIDHLYEAVKRGAKAIVSSSDNKLTRDLFCFFQIHDVRAFRSINPNGNRYHAKEFIAVLTPDMI